MTDKQKTLVLEVIEAYSKELTSEECGTDSPIHLWMTLGDILVDYKWKNNNE